jgi:hypothetical protein
VKSRWPLALVLDGLGVVAFVAIGRASHHHGETAQGIASTLWPFGVGTVVGWAVLAARTSARRSVGAGPASVASGVTVCVSTVALGMVLRVVVGQGTAPAFIVVATGFLGAVMVGWRAVLGAGARRLASRGRSSLRR